MSQYSIIKHGAVSNVIEATEQFILDNYDDDIVVLGAVPIGYLYEGNGNFRSDVTLSLGTAAFVDTAGFNPIFEGAVLDLANQTVKYADNSDVLIDLTDVNKYFPLIDTEVHFAGDIVDDQGNPVAAINAPRINLVVEMQSDDKPNGIEFYLVGNIVAGHLTVSGKFPNASNYKITAARNNRALDRLFAPADSTFHMNFTTLDFLI